MQAANRLTAARLIQFAQCHGDFSAPGQTLTSFFSTHRMTQILPESTQEGALLQKIRLSVQKRTQNRLISAMQTLLARFQTCGIRCLFLKGPLLGLELYGELGVRPTSDLDVFVAEAQFGDALDALTSLGYTRKNGIPYSKEDAVYELHRGDPRLKVMGRHISALHSLEENAITIELHASAFRHYAAISSDLFEQHANLLFLASRTFAYQDVIYPVLGVLDSFLMLSAHFSRHVVEAISEYCSTKNPLPPPLHNLHDLALFYAHHAAELDPLSLLNRAKAFGCCADLAVACRCLSEIYDIGLYKAVQPDLTQIASADSDYENDLYWAIASRLSAADLFFGSMPNNLSALKPVIPIRCSYRCQPVENSDDISDDCFVHETFDCPEKPALRDAFSFRFGVGWSKETLIFHVSLPKAGISFLEDCPKSYRKTCIDSNCQKNCAGQRCANTSIRLLLPGMLCPTTAGSCMNIYEITFLETPEGLLPIAERNGCRCDLPVRLSSESDGCFHLRFQLPNPSLEDAESCRFMISREILLPYAHKPEQAIAFSVRWFNSVSVSHKTCLSCGELRQGNSRL